jgi:hypothetical protein
MIDTTRTILAVGTLAMMCPTQGYAQSTPNVLCAFGYIHKIDASISYDGGDGQYFYHVYLDTASFNSPRKQVNLTFGRDVTGSRVDSSRYDAQVFAEATSLLRDAFTSRRPVRVYVVSQNLKPNYCNGNATQLRFEVCSNNTCVVP